MRKGVTDKDGSGGVKLKLLNTLSSMRYLLLSKSLTSQQVSNSIMMMN